MGEATPDHSPRSDDADGSASRKIIHVDMDAFFASVEQRDNPMLRGRPVAVGGSRARGVVAAASYEARTFGVHSAMPSITAKRKCPDLVFVRPRFDVYHAVSAQIREIFAEHTALIEPLSLDEAYLDVTENRHGIATATEIARIIRAKIKAETGLTASAGISYNKFLAKLASSQRKPDGQFVIIPTRGPAFVERLPVGKFHGIGPATAAKMQRLGILTGSDLRDKDRTFLLTHFGKSGHYFFWVSRGIDHRPVRPDRIRKSVGAEDTFGADLTTLAEARGALLPIIDKVWQRCHGHGTWGRTVTLKVKYADFQMQTRSRTEALPVVSRSALETVTLGLLEPLFPAPQGIRLLGVSISSLSGGEARSPYQMQLSL